jgi:hypothetical protein
MAILSVVATGGAGTVALVAASAGGDSFQNSGTERLIVHNAAGASRRVKVLGGAQACNFGLPGTPGHDVEYTIPAGVRWEFAPFRTDRFNDANQRVQLTYPDGVAGPVNVGVYV